MFDLKIEKSAYRGTLGMDYILGILTNSELFNTEYHTDHLKTQRGERACIIYFEDKKIYLDFWEYYNPTHSKEAYDANFDLMIKLQHHKFSLDDYHNRCRRKNVLQHVSKEEREVFYKKIVPWTFFPSNDMLHYMKLNNCVDGPVESLPEKQLAFFSGKNWKGRHFWFDLLDKQNDDNMVLLRHDGNARHQKRGNNVYIRDVNEYLDLMRSSKYGLVLAGRGSMLTQAKNRREIDYMIMKKPLVINYDPYYYEDFVEGTHYIKLTKDTVIKDIENNYGVDKIAENAYDWYKRNASRHGVARSFLYIMESELKSYPETNFEV